MAILDFFRRSPASSQANLPSRSHYSTTLGEMATREVMSGAGFDQLFSLLPNPDPVLRKLGKDIAVYRDLLTDEHLAGVVDTRKDSVRELEWEIDRGRAKSRQTEVVRKMFAELNIYQIISEVLDAPLFGYQPMEYIWEERDGLIWLKNIVGKPQEWFTFAADNSVRLMAANAPFGGIPLPEGKFFIAQHEPRYLNPYGTAILGRCFWPVTFGKGGMKFLVTFAERYGMPWVLAQYPDESSQEFIDSMIARMDAARQDATLVFPESSKPEIIPNGQKASADIFDTLIDRCEARISKAILGHGAAADSTPGKLGNEEGAEGAKWGRSASDKRLVEAVMNDAIKWIHRYNFDSGEPPRFTFYEEQDVDQSTADRDGKLFAIGWRPTPEYIQREYGLEPDKDFTLDFGGGAAPVEPAAPGVEFAEGTDEATQKGIDAAADKAQSTQAVTKGLVDPIIDLIKKSTSVEQALDLLASTYPNISTEKMEEMLTRYMFMSDVLGRVEAQNQLADNA